MAGWDDLAQPAGSLEPGYMLDVTLVNTYIKAINERARYCGFIGISPSNEPLPEIPEDACIFHYKKVDLNGSQPWLFQGDYVSILFYRVWSMMNKTWVKQSVWDDPLSTQGVSVDVDASWSLDEMKDLIGEDYFNILSDPYAPGIKLTDFYSAGMFNAIYQLYSEVFIYIESADMDNGVYVPFVPGATGSNLSKLDLGSTDLIDESIDDEDLATVNNFTNVTVKNIYDANPINIDTVFTTSPGRTASDIVESGAYSYFDGDDYSFAYNGDMSLSYEYTMESYNHDGDFVEFERKETTWITRNCITDYDRDTFIAGGPAAYNENIAEYPAVNVALDTTRFEPYQDPIRVLAEEPLNSFIDVDGWHVKLGIGDKPPYRYLSGDFVFPISGAGVFDYTRKATYFNLNHRNTGEPDGDLIFNLNVAGMIYNTLP